MRIRWTDDERVTIVDIAAQLIHTKQSFSLRDALQKSVDTLPKDRRRKIAALTQVPWFTDSVPQKIKELERKSHQAKEEEIQQVVNTVEQQARERLEEQVAEYVGKILSRALSYAVKQPELKTLLMLSPAISHEIRHHPLPKHHRERLRRVIVAGAINAQARALESEFKNRLDIRFWTKDQSSDTLKSMLAHADAAVGMVGFLAHSHDSIIKASKVPYTPVSGGVTQVKQALERLLETA